MTKTDIDYYDDAIRRHTTIPADKLAQIRADYEERKRKAQEKLVAEQTLLALRSVPEDRYKMIQTDTLTSSRLVHDLSELASPEARAALAESMQNFLLQDLEDRQVVSLDTYLQWQPHHNAYCLSLVATVISRNLWS